MSLSRTYHVSVCIVFIKFSAIVRATRCMLTSFDGDIVGTVDGLPVGETDGSFDGDAEGFILGLFEGDRLGLRVGCEALTL